MTPERRQSVLTETDFERIEQAFDRRIARLMETVGYDITTPESRAEIYADHRFVRSTRQAKGRLIAGFITAIGSAVSMIFYIGAQWFLKMRDGGHS